MLRTRISRRASKTANSEQRFESPAGSTLLTSYESWVPEVRGPQRQVFVAGAEVSF